MEQREMLTIPNRCKSELSEAIVREFSADMLQEDRCRDLVLHTIHKEARCPRCLAELQRKQVINFWANERVQCHICGRFSTALSDTVLSGTKLTFTKIALLLFMLGTHAEARDVAWRIGIDVSAVRAWRRKLKLGA